MAMLGLGHLVRLTQFNARLLEAYTKSHDPTSSMRSINLPELIAADQQIWDEVFRLARLPEWDVDKALYEVLETSSIADRVLAPRPTISRADTEWIAQRVQKGSGKGTGEPANKKRKVAENQQKGEVKASGKGKEK